MVDFPTHQSGSTIDLVFTDKPDKINNVYPLGQLGNGDHTMVMVEFTAGTEKLDAEKTMVPNWKKLNLPGLKSDISSTNWDEVLGDLEGEDLWDAFKVKFDSIISNNLPRKTIKKGTQPVWMTCKLKRLILEKNQAYKSGNKVKVKSLTKQIKYESILQL